MIVQFFIGQYVVISQMVRDVAFKAAYPGSSPGYH